MVSLFLLTTKANNENVRNLFVVLAQVRENGLHLIALPLGTRVLADALLQELQRLLVLAKRLRLLFSRLLAARCVTCRRQPPQHTYILPDTEQLHDATFVRSESGDFADELSGNARLLRQAALVARLTLRTVVLRQLVALLEANGESFDGFGHDGTKLFAFTATFCLEVGSAR